MSAPTPPLDAYGNPVWSSTPVAPRPPQDAQGNPVWTPAPPPAPPQVKNPLQLLVEQLKRQGIPDDQIVSTIQRLSGLGQAAPTPPPVPPIVKSPDQFGEELRRLGEEEAVKRQQEAVAAEARKIEALKASGPDAGIKEEDFEAAVTLNKTWEPKEVEELAMNRFMRENPVTGTFVKDLRTLQPEQWDQVPWTIPAESVEVIQQLITNQIPFSAVAPETLAALNTQTDQWRKKNLIQLYQELDTEGIVIRPGEHGITALMLTQGEGARTDTSDLRDLPNTYFADVEKRMEGRDFKITGSNLYTTAEYGPTPKMGVGALSEAVKGWAGLIDEVIITDGALYGVTGADMLMDFKTSRGVTFQTVDENGEISAITMPDKLISKVPKGAIAAGKRQFAPNLDKLDDAMLVNLLTQFDVNQLDREATFDNGPITAYLKEHGFTDAESATTINMLWEVVENDRGDLFFDSLAKSALLKTIDVTRPAWSPALNGLSAIPLPPSTMVAPLGTQPPFAAAAIILKELENREKDQINVGDLAVLAGDALTEPAEYHKQLTVQLAQMSRSDDRRVALLGGIGLGGLFATEVAVVVGVTALTAGTTTPLWAVGLTAVTAGAVPLTTAVTAVGTTAVDSRLLDELNKLPEDERRKFDDMWLSIIAVPGKDTDLAIQLREHRESMEKAGISTYSYNYIDTLTNEGNAFYDTMFTIGNDPWNFVVPEAVGLNVPKKIMNFKNAEQLMEFGSREEYIRAVGRIGAGQGNKLDRVLQVNEKGPKNPAGALLQFLNPMGRTSSAARYDKATDMANSFGVRVIGPVAEQVAEDKSLVGASFQEAFLGQFEHTYGSANTPYDNLAADLGGSHPINKVHRQAEDIGSEVFATTEWQNEKKLLLKKEIAPGATEEERLANFLATPKANRHKYYVNNQDFIGAFTDAFVSHSRTRILQRYGASADELPLALSLQQFGRSTTGIFLETPGYVIRNTANNMLNAFVNGINPFNLFTAKANSRYFEERLGSEAAGSIRTVASGMAGNEEAAISGAEKRGLVSQLFNRSSVFQRKTGTTGKIAPALSFWRREGSIVEANAKHGIMARVFKSHADRALQEMADTAVIPAFLPPHIQAKLRAHIAEGKDLTKSGLLKVITESDGTYSVEQGWTLKELFSESPSALRFLEEHPVLADEVDGKISNIVSWLREGRITSTDAKTMIIEEMQTTYVQTIQELEKHFAFLGPDSPRVLSPDSLDRVIDTAANRFLAGYPYTEHQLLIDAATSQFSYINVSSYVENQLSSMYEIAGKMNATDIWLRGNDAMRASSKKFTDEIISIGEQQDALYTSVGGVGGIAQNDLERGLAHQRLREGLGKIVDETEDWEEAVRQKEAFIKQWQEEMKSLDRGHVERPKLDREQLLQRDELQKQRDKLVIQYRKDQMENLQVMRDEISELMDATYRQHEPFDDYIMRAKQATQGMPEGTTKATGLKVGDRFEHGGDRYKVMHVASNGVVRVEDVVTGKASVLRGIKDLDGIVYRAHEIGLVRGDIEFLKARRSLTISKDELDTLKRLSGQSVMAELGGKFQVSPEDREVLRKLRARLGFRNNMGMKELFQQPKVQELLNFGTKEYTDRMRKLASEMAPFFKRPNAYRSPISRAELARMLGGTAPEDIPTAASAAYWNAVLHRKAVRDLGKTIDTSLSEVIKPAAHSFTKEQAALVNQFAAQAVKDRNYVYNSALVHAQGMADWVLHNYNNTYNFDFMLRWIFPWELWMTRSAAKYSILAAQNPGLARGVYNAQQGLQKSTDDLPDHIKRTLGAIPIPIPFAGVLPDHLKGDWYTTAYSTVLPTDMFDNYTPFEERQSSLGKLLGGDTMKDKTGIPFSLGANPFAVMAFKKFGWYGEAAKKNWLGTSLPIVDTYGQAVAAAVHRGMPSFPARITLTSSDARSIGYTINGLMINGEITEEEGKAALLELDKKREGSWRNLGGTLFGGIYTDNAVLKRAIMIHDDRALITKTSNRFLPLQLIQYDEASQKYDKAKDDYFEFKKGQPDAEEVKIYFDEHPELALMSLMGGGAQPSVHKAEVAISLYYTKVEEVDKRKDAEYAAEIEKNGPKSPQLDVIEAQRRAEKDALALTAEEDWGAIFNNGPIKLTDDYGKPLPMEQWLKNIVNLVTNSNDFTHEIDGNKVYDAGARYKMEQALIGGLSPTMKAAVEHEMNKNKTPQEMLVKAVSDFYFAGRADITKTVKDENLKDSAARAKRTDELESEFKKPTAQEIFYIMAVHSPGRFTLAEVRDMMSNPALLPSLNASSQLDHTGKIKAMEESKIGFISSSGEMVHMGNLERYKTAYTEQQLVYSMLDAGRPPYEAFEHWTPDVELFFGSGQAGMFLMLQEKANEMAMDNARLSKNWDEYYRIKADVELSRQARTLLGVPAEAGVNFDDILVATQAQRDLANKATQAAKDYTAGRIDNREYTDAVSAALEAGMYITKEGAVLNGEAAAKVLSQERNAANSSESGTGTNITRGVDEDGDGVIDRRYTVEELMQAPDFMTFKNELLTKNFEPGDNLPEDRTFAMLLEQNANTRGEIATLWKQIYDMTQLVPDSELAKAARSLPNNGTVLFGRSVQRVRTASYILAIDDMLKSFGHEPQFKNLTVPTSSEFERGVVKSVNRTAGSSIQTTDSGSSSRTTSSRTSQVNKAQEKVVQGSGYTQLVYGVNSWQDAVQASTTLFGSTQLLEDLQNFWNTGTNIPAASLRRLKFLSAVMPIEGATTFQRWMSGLQLIFQSDKLFSSQGPALPRSKFPTEIRERRF